MSAETTALRGVMTGPVLGPGDDGWDAARQAWNLAFDRSPSLVAQPASAEDVVAIVEFARKQGLRVARRRPGTAPAPWARSTGPSWSRPRASAAWPSMPTAATARVGAGVLWGEVAAAADPHGLFPLAGSSPGSASSATRSAAGWASSGGCTAWPPTT